MKKKTRTAPKARRKASPKAKPKRAPKPKAAPVNAIGRPIRNDDYTKPRHTTILLEGPVRQQIDEVMAAVNKEHGLEVLKSRIETIRYCVSQTHKKLTGG